MKFHALDTLIPNVPADKTKLHQNTIYISGGFGWSIRVRYPGKHDESRGDFVIEAMSEGVWDEYHPFKHSDLFEDVQAKVGFSNEINEVWVPHLLSVVQGETHPVRFYGLDSPYPGVHLDALTNALLALAVCEYRRYPQGDKRGGGRYLPTNYMLAMLQGYWTPDEASSRMREGFPALRRLKGFVPFTEASNPESYVSHYHAPSVR